MHAVAAAAEGAEAVAPRTQPRAALVLPPSSALRSLDRSTRMSAKCVQQPIIDSSDSSNSALIIRRTVSLPSCGQVSTRGPPYDSSITCSKWAAILAPPPFSKKCLRIRILSPPFLSILRRHSLVSQLPRKKLSVFAINFPKSHPMKHG